MADFNSKILIQTPIERQFTQTMPANGQERERSAAPSGVKPLFHSRCEEKSGSELIAVYAVKVRSGVRYPPLSPAPPGRGSVSSHRLRRARFGAN